MQLCIVVLPLALKQRMLYVGHTVNGPVKLIPSPLPQALDRLQPVDQTTWRQQLHTIVLGQQDETECEMKVRMVRRKKVIPGRVQLRTLKRLAYAVHELVNDVLGRMHSPCLGGVDVVQEHVTVTTGNNYVDERTSVTISPPISHDGTAVSIPSLVQCGQSLSD
ncbi:hypothetical protein O6H91_21G015400 [Diphasiastrum complanatum]|uniref:Uncharacterized protein n=1 Tax=Diphasiastrum complanatum TaxID=34168 RepID=A0ACC2AIB2_DIPCM|nr:hypothetical protein O6H91_21G015400 [Diphasiastrum complanatum]